MKEQERQRAIRLRLARSQESNGGVLPTGFHALDAALGGGIPRGAIVELFGASSSGKTTLALQIVASAQIQGATAAWIDAEHVFDGPYARVLGVTLEAMPLAQPMSAEQALEIAARLTASGAVELLVLDSAAALVPRLELSSGMGDGGEGLHSRVLASGLRRFTKLVQRHNTALVVLNQTRSRKQPTGVDAETSAGGAPLKLHASVRIALSSLAGGRVRFRVLKNRASAAFRDGEFRRGSNGEFVESP